VFEIDHAATVGRECRPRNFRRLITVHPHPDPRSKPHRAAAKDADEQLRQWTDDEQ
jgi:hypothetical protein